jgi:hypothetical protein
MTTGESDNIVVDAAEIWRAIGRLEGDTAALLEGQRELQAGLQDVCSEMREVRSEMRSDFRDVYRRIDRLFFAVLGIGGALVAAVVVNSFVTG